MELRDYQKECIDTMKSYTGERALIVMATGLGKTVTFSEFLRYEAIENDRQCLILSHRDELVRNPLKYLDDMQCGVEIAEKHAKGYEKIISASVQSIVNRLNKFNPFAISTVVIDECHHSAAPTYRKIIDYFRSATVFGFTATAKRGDGIGLGVVFDDIIFERDLLWGIKHGFLCPIEGMVVRLKYSLESVKIINDDFSDNDLAKVMSGTAIGISEIYTKHAKGQTIIFAPSVSEAEEITRNINKTHGNIAKTITAQTKNRDKILNDFLHGKIKVLTNFAVLTEGVDLPCTETVIIAKPTAKSNPGAYAQMVGRGVRLHPGKTSCLVIDCVGISDIPICTAATLLGKDLPPPKKESIIRLPPPPEDDKNIKILTKDEVPTTFIRTQKEVDIMSKNISYDTHGVKWHKLLDGSIILTLPSLTFLVDPMDSEGNVLLKRNKTSAKKRMPAQFVYDYVYNDLKTNHKEHEKMWSEDKAKVFRNAPATSKQIDLIKKLDPKFSDFTKLSCADATAIITNLLYNKKGANNAS